jgi:hypothetical protein
MAHGLIEESESTMRNLGFGHAVSNDSYSVLQASLGLALGGVPDLFEMGAGLAEVLDTLRVAQGQLFLDLLLYTTIPD